MGAEVKMWECPSCHKESPATDVKFATAARFRKGPNLVSSEHGKPIVCPQCHSIVIPIPDPAPPSSAPGKGEGDVKLTPYTKGTDGGEDPISLALFTDDQEFIATTTGMVFVKIKKGKHAGVWQYGSKTTQQKAEAVVQAAADKLGGTLLRFGK